MAHNIDITVDTQPMAEQLHRVSNHVDGVSGAVVAMKTAVVAAEAASAERICDNLNEGFYTLMQSQITQKIAQLSSKVESLLIELGQQSAALIGIRQRMERDYNMISHRYTKLFGTLDAALKARIFEIDKPTVNLVNREMRVNENRMRGVFAYIPTNQHESIALSQLIAASKTKKDSANAIQAIHAFVKETNSQIKHSADVMHNQRIDHTRLCYVPVAVTEASDERGCNFVGSHTPQSGISAIDGTLPQAAHQVAFETVRNGRWEDMAPQESDAVSAEFAALVARSSASSRTKEVMARLYNAHKPKSLNS